MARNRRRQSPTRTLSDRLLRRLGNLPWVQRVQNYGFMHVHLFVASLGRICRTPVASAMTVLVIAIALTLPASFHTLVDNLGRAGGNLEATNHIAIFLKPEVVNEVGSRIARKLSEHPQVKDARLVSKEEGLQEFRRYSGFGEALRLLDFNPLPAVVTVTPKDSLTRPEDVERLIGELKGIDEADFVQMDTEWMHKLSAILSIARRTVGLLDILLAMAVLLIVSNTIRLELHAREEEIAITKLMGATDGFVRRPFLYTGFWFGLGGGLLAWILMSLLILLLDGPVSRLATLYGGDFELEFLSGGKSLTLILAAAGLGIAGAWGVVDYHLRRMTPS